MNDKFFLDTNIFIYSFDKSNPAKQERAKELISKALYQFSGCISYQVIQEFLNVATQKFEIPLKKQDCNLYITNVLEPLCEIFSGIELFQDALEIQEGWKYSFYDSLIISAAIRSKSKILYTEDLQHGQRIRDLRIENPFLN
ncbi:MAG: PIN domain-containing protein [Calditrichaeota bacterium]|nr:PIN domain-containing protein [Calditrichota bacterium]